MMTSSFARLGSRQRPANQFGAFRIGSLNNRSRGRTGRTMVRLHLSTLDLTKTRFAFSPLWETVMGFRVMQEPSGFVIHLPWVCEACEATRDLDLGLLSALVQPRGYIPDFMTPPPVTPLPEFEAELRVLLATDLETVRREVRRTYEHKVDLPEVIQPFLTDHAAPRASGRATAHVLDAHPRAALAAFPGDARE
ncbi:MAG: hypothetical protein HC933_08765 [Pleurocapsa sp. SU_196_0]|nr:hypothetical protein [Pleurocapsa sp. SU_196_0]